MSKQSKGGGLSAELAGQPNDSMSKRQAEAAVRTDLANRRAIEARNSELLPVPRDELPQADASLLVRKDLTAFRAIENPIARRDAAGAMGDNADKQVQYKAELVRQDPQIAEVVVSLHAAFRAQLEQARQIEAGKQHAQEAFTRFKAEQQARQRQAELGPASFPDLADAGLSEALKKSTRETHTSRPGEQSVRLESLGKGVSVADVDEKTSQVVIRRSGRVIERFDDDKAISEFADKKKLSTIDRETMARLAELRRAEPATRSEAKLTLGPDVKMSEPELVNVLASDPDKARIRAEIERNDPETYAWVEKQRKARQQRDAPNEVAAIAAAAAPKASQAKGDDSIEKEAIFASPNARKAVPPEVGSQYVQVGEKFFHRNNTTVVAFVDRGDKLETQSSAPKMAEALVKIAETRGWDELRVKGTEGFRREVWLEASVRGIHVDGYKPSDMDKAELERRNSFMRDQNSVEVRSKAFQNLPPEEGTRKDPSLANAYAVIQAARAFARERIPDQVQQTAFVESTKARVVSDLEAGRTTPAVNIRAAVRKREAEKVLDLDHRRDRER